MHTLVVMHRLILYENVDSAKIKVPFLYYRYRYFMRALMHRIVIHCIDKSMNRYTPTDDTWTILPDVITIFLCLDRSNTLAVYAGSRIKNILIVFVDERRSGFGTHQGE